MCYQRLKLIFLNSGASNYKQYELFYLGNYNDISINIFLLLVEEVVEGESVVAFLDSLNKDILNYMKLNNKKCSKPFVIFNRNVGQP